MIGVTGGLRVTCEYMAHQEGVMCEELQILSESKENVCVKVKVHARVMGKYIRLFHSNCDCKVISCPLLVHLRIAWWWSHIYITHIYCKCFVCRGTQMFAQ